MMAMNDTMRRVLLVTLRVFLGWIFLAAGWSKLGEPMVTLASVYSYQIVLPDWLAEAIALALPWVELALASALFVGLWMPWTLAATAAVLGAFSIVTAQAWWRQLDIDCGCFNFASIHPALEVLSTPGGATMRNLLLLGVVGVLAWLRAQGERPRGAGQAAAH